MLDEKISLLGRKVASVVIHKEATHAFSQPEQQSYTGGLRIKADDLHESAEKQNRLESPEYKKQQESLFEDATKVVNTAVVRDGDDD